MMTNCRMTIERLYPYLDRELSEQEIEEVADHLRRCPPCARHFAFEAGMLSFVSDACKSVKAPPDLVARILSRRTASIESDS